jgi:hypothetical protein
MGHPPLSDTKGSAFLKGQAIKSQGPSLAPYIFQSGNDFSEFQEGKNGVNS